jgi:hypothetical protein
VLKLLKVVLLIFLVWASPLVALQQLFRHVRELLLLLVQQVLLLAGLRVLFQTQMAPLLPPMVRHTERRNNADS